MMAPCHHFFFSPHTLDQPEATSKFSTLFVHFWALALPIPCHHPTLIKFSLYQAHMHSHKHFHSISVTGEPLHTPSIKNTHFAILIKFSLRQAHTSIMTPHKPFHQFPITCEPLHPTSIISCSSPFPTRHMSSICHQIASHPSCTAKAPFCQFRKSLSSSVDPCTGNLSKMSQQATHVNPNPKCSWCRARPTPLDETASSHSPPLPCLGLAPIVPFANAPLA